MEAPELEYRPRDANRRDWRIGLVGCGEITKSHLNAYRAAGYEVVAFSNPTLAKAEARRDEYFPDAAVYADHAELLTEAQVDVVDVATHPDVRPGIVRDCLEHGAHVLSQKPFVTDLDEGRALCDLAEDRGRLLAVNQNGRWAPHFAWMRAAIRAGLIGDVKRVEMSVEWDHSWTAGTVFDETPHLVLFDFGIHWFDVLATFTPGQDAERVEAREFHVEGQKNRSPMGAEVDVRLRTAAARLAFNGAAPTSRDTTLVEGTLGVLRSEGPDLQRQTVTLETERGRCSPALQGQWFDDGFRGTMGELLRAVEEERRPSNDARGNLSSLALAFAACASARSGSDEAPGRVRELQ